MKKVVRLSIVLCLALLWQTALRAQETWSVQHIVDNDDVISGINQASNGDAAPRDNRGLALSSDGKFLYLGYNNPANKRVVRKIDLSVADPAQNHQAVVKQLLLPSGGAPAKSIATDDKGRVYLALATKISIYDADLNVLLHTITGFTACEGVAVARESGTLAVYASDRTAKTLKRFVLTEGAGNAVSASTKAGLDGDGEVVIAGAIGLRGLAVQSNGTIWLADIGAAKVFRANPNGSLQGNTSLTNGMDVAIDESKGEVYVTQNTTRAVKVLNLADGTVNRTLTPPFTTLQLAQAANSALAGIDVIPGRLIYIANESEKSILSGDPPDSPFSNSGDDNNFADADNDPILAAMHPLVADAGLDQQISSGASATLGGSPTAMGGTPPYTYSWIPNTGLNNSNLANPTASPITTTKYTVTVKDALNRTAMDEVTVNVTVATQSFVMLVNRYVRIDKNISSEGDIYSNNKIEFMAGAPGTHTGNLRALTDVTLRNQNTVVGNVIAGNEIYLLGSATITGTQTKHASLSALSLPSRSFSAGGSNKTVLKNGTLALSPGSYNQVIVSGNATLFLSAGDYYMNVLKIDDKAKLSVDVAGGSANIFVVTDLHFAGKAQVLITGAGASTTKLSFWTLNDAKVNIGKEALFQGNLIAQNARVNLGRDCRFKGALTADSVIADQGARFVPHGSSTIFPKESEEESEVTSARLAVSSYQLVQNYPNPFSQIPRFAENPGTVIGFALPSKSKVTLRIYNETGQLVQTLAEQEMSSGRHELRWHGRNQSGYAVAAGVYLYQLVVTGEDGEAVFAETKRMTVLK